MSYRDDLSIYSLPTLSFLVQYNHYLYSLSLPFFDRRVRWKEQQRGDCILQESNTVDHAYAWNDTNHLELFLFQDDFDLHVKRMSLNDTNYTIVFHMTVDMCFLNRKRRR